MGLIFKKGIVLKDVFADPAKRKLAGEAISKYMRQGFYDAEERPIPNRRLISAEMIKTMPLKDILALRGEYITQADITGAAAVGVQRKEIFMPDVPADTQYLGVFRTVQSEKAGETYEEATAGITFTQLKLGEKPKLGTITHAAPYVPNLKWGAAFGFHREWIVDNEVWKFEDLVRKAKIAALDAKATFLYGLIAAAGWAEIAYATSWINTLNLAYAALRKAKKLLPNQTPVLVIPVEKLAVVLQAIKDSLVTEARGERITRIPDVLDTGYVEDSDKKMYYLTPFERFILQEREALRTEQDQDIMLDAMAYAWYFRMNGAILDTAYGRKITWA